MTGLLYSEVESALRAELRAMLRQHSDPPARIERADPVDVDLWRRLADMGLAGLLVPEELGGAGASPREAAVVLEELGRAVAPVPYLGCAVVAGTALLSCGEPDLLAGLAAGERPVALAVPFAGPPSGAWSPTVTAAGDRLTGSVRAVADAITAEILLVPAGAGLFAVEARRVRREQCTSLDETRRLCDLSFDGTPGRLLAEGADAETAVRDALLAGAALLASEQVGVAEWCLDTTVEHARGRYQFGRPIGSFQAVKHRLADVWVAVTQARAVARYAASAVAEKSEVEVAAALAQAHCSGVAVEAAEACVQLHGGIGMTWEHPAHLYLKRARSAALAYGAADVHRARLAELVDLPPA
ncbi:alkylation response protein AidB-like acyl-CoA dehydrogenase [Hamadaea flava]|uniref:Acyl-CoA dehydrogenase family protein n=1 Tax=Hamadaea flava TaxID=1742688 RepID=A0ABV8LVY0_9ACTN|nr:acyl-CoA dehydrogenase family protein [Hamadaea flava]MCP2327750.1 alkylation response protein AidB-like acyl-CoA dehydrogenase [Hamadaea flava]